MLVNSNVPHLIITCDILIRMMNAVTHWAQKVFGYGTLRIRREHEFLVHLEVSVDHHL